MRVSQRNQDARSDPLQCLMDTRGAIDEDACDVALNAFMDDIAKNACSMRARRRRR